jgi:hypothetical protein
VNPETIVILGFLLLAALTFHEWAHAAAATACGDDLPRTQGRLTLNPLSHIDLFGTIILPLVLITLTGFMFGYAKPVQFRPENFRKPTRDTALVAMAGPAANVAILLLALIVATVVSRVILQVGSEASAQRDVFGGHAAADGERFAACRPPLQLLAPGFHRALPADARQEHVFPDRLGRQRVADRAARAEPVQREVRADLPTTRISRASADARAIPKPISRELHRAVRGGRKGRRGGLQALWTPLGLSYDWDQEYATIDEHCRRISQLSFLELLEKGEVYQAERPVMWDVDFRRPSRRRR